MLHHKSINNKWRRTSHTHICTQKSTRQPLSWASEGEKRRQMPRRRRSFVVQIELPKPTKYNKSVRQIWSISDKFAPSLRLSSWPTNLVKFWRTRFPGRLIWSNLDKYWAWLTKFWRSKPTIVFQWQKESSGANLKSLAKESETQAQSSSNIISNYKLKIEEYHLSFVRDFSKFYNDIEKLNILAFGERLNLKSQEKIILSVHSYWYGMRL